MAKNDPKPPEDDASDLVKFRSLAIRVASIPKDAVYDLYPKPKTKKTKKAVKKPKR